MSTPIWNKTGTEIDPEVLAFTRGEDPYIDNHLVPYDIIGSIAHANGLERIGMLTLEESGALIDTLRTLYMEWQGGEFRLDEEDERLGDVGKKIHAGRSRNDQVLTAIRLFLKATVIDLLLQQAQLIATLIAAGKEHENHLMPGYTHGQRAMPSSIGFWYASHADTLADSLEAGMLLFERLNRSPLGAAAGFGVSIDLDREFTAEQMGFAGVQVNAASVQNSRGKLEAEVLHWLFGVMRDIGRMAWDLLTFTTSEYGFVTIPEAFCTGSSIMPQKKNPDVLELLRGLQGVVGAARDEVERVIDKLPSNYHRDYQLAKPALFRGVDKARAGIQIMTKVVSGLEWDLERCLDACTDEIYATHRAVSLVMADGALEEWERDPAKVLAGLSHLGAPGNPGLTEAEERTDEIRHWIENTSAEMFGAWKMLLEQ
jgi:argininosuccinate lyase